MGADDVRLSGTGGCENPVYFFGFLIAESSPLPNKKYYQREHVLRLYTYSLAGKVEMPRAGDYNQRPKTIECTPRL